MKVSKKLREILLQDYEKASNNVINILKYPDTNYRVGDPDYLTPTIASPALPLESEKGSYTYYRRIRLALEFPLNNQKIPSVLRPARFPKYLENLISKR